MESRPRLDVVSPFLDKRHGTEMCVAEQLERLAAGYEIRLYSSRVEDVDLRRMEWRRVPALPGPHLAGYLWWFVANSIVRWWDRKRGGLSPDLTYSPGINCLDADIISVHIVFAEFSRQVEKKLRLLSNPIKSWPLLIHRLIYYRLIQALERRVYSRQDVCLVAVSKKVAEDLNRFYRRTENVQVVYHGCDLKRFNPYSRAWLRNNARAEIGLLQDEFAILLVGNDWKKKGLSCLLEATVKLANPAIRLLVVGRDDATPFHAILQQPGLTGRVAFLPLRPDVEFYYAAADLYAGPSLEDAFALPPLEAMACGVPVIVSRQAGVSELIHHGVDGMILENPEDSATLAEWIQRQIEDASFRSTLSENAVRTAQAYTWENNSAAMSALFAKTIQARQEQRSRRKNEKVEIS